MAGLGRLHRKSLALLPAVLAIVINVGMSTVVKTLRPELDGYVAVLALERIHTSPAVAIAKMYTINCKSVI